MRTILGRKLLLRRNRFMNNTLPRDPMLLLSVVNTKLRDCYQNLDALCEDMNISKDEMISKLEQIDYTYDEKTNQFI